MAASPNPAKATVTFNLADDFSVTSNPNGPWSFGWKSSIASSLNVFDTLLTPYYGGDRWYDPEIASPYYVPQVWKNNTGTVLFGLVQPGDVTVHPGSSGELGTVRFTAPVSGTYSASGFFNSYNQTPMQKFVVSVINGGSSTLNATDSVYNPFNFADLVLAAGDYLDFLVGPTIFNSIAGGDTTLSLSIIGHFDSANPSTPTPEPGAILLMGMGMIGLGAMRRKTRLPFA